MHAHAHLGIFRRQSDPELTYLSLSFPAAFPVRSETLLPDSRTRNHQYTAAWALAAAWAKGPTTGPAGPESESPDMSCRYY